MIRSRFFGLLFALAVCAQVARAEDLSSILEVLEENVVSGASRSAERSRDAPALSTVVTSEQLKLFGIQRLDEAINLLSLGMFASDRMSTAEVGARGVSLTRDANSHVLVVLDGMVVNEQGGGAAYLHDIPLDVVDHIEVILGPGSVLYGAQAMFGVINVATRSAREHDGYHATATLGASPPVAADGSIDAPSLSTLGFYNKYTLSLGRSFRLAGEEAGVLASLQYEDFDGPRVTFPKQRLPRDAQGDPSVDLGPNAEPGRWGGPVDDQWYRRTLGAYVRLDVGDLSLSTRATFTRLGVPLSDLYENRNGTYDDLRNYNDQQLVLSDLRYRLRIDERLEGMARVYFGYSNNARSRFVISHDPLVEGVPLGVLDPEQCPIGPTGPCRKEARFPVRWIGLELQTLLDWWADGVSTTMVGVDGRARTAAYEFVTFDVDSGQSYGSDPAQTRWHGGGHDIADEYALGAYLQQVVRPWKYLALNAGARLDLDSRIPTEYLADAFSPRVALIATPTDRLAFKLIYSGAFRAPSFVELNIVNGRLLPNPEGLRPETVASYEAIASLRVGSHAFTLGGFYAQWNDLIELQIVKAQAPAVSHYDNVQSIDNYGANLSYEGSALDRQLRFGLNATYAIARRNLSSAEQARNPGIGSSVPVTVAPKLFGNVHGSYSYGQGAVALAAGYFSRRIADQAYYGGDPSNLAPSPVAPSQLETRLTLTGDIAALPGLEYMVGASYFVTGYQPYVVGPNQGQPSYLVPKAVDADLALVNRFTLFAGLSLHLGAADSTQAAKAATPEVQ